jgi:hypothetical protein
MGNEMVAFKLETTNEEAQIEKTDAERTEELKIEKIEKIEKADKTLGSTIHRSGNHPLLGHYSLYC